MRTEATRGAVGRQCDTPINGRQSISGPLAPFSSFAFCSLYSPLQHLTTGDRGAVHNLPRLDRGPLVTLNPDAQGKKTSQKGEGLDTHLFTVIHLWLSGPVQELGNILGHLGGGGRGAILVLDKAIEKDTGHTNSCDERN